jgi:putative NADH-flavin reductase
MKIAVFGATGGTGRQIVEQALAAGHHVTALVRDSAKLDIGHPNLTKVVGNVLEPTAVQETVMGSDAVAVSLGNSANNPDGIVTKGTKGIITAMQGMGIQRLVIVSSLGVGDSKEKVPFFFKMLMSTVLKKAMQDKESQEAAVRASGLAWVIVRPGGLTDGPITGKAQIATDNSLSVGQVSRADVAALVLDELTSPQAHIGSAVAIT